MGGCIIDVLWHLLATGDHHRPMWSTTVLCQGSLDAHCTMRGLRSTATSSTSRKQKTHNPPCSHVPLSPTSTLHSSFCCATIIGSRPTKSEALGRQLGLPRAPPCRATPTLAVTAASSSNRQPPTPAAPPTPHGRGPATPTPACYSRRPTPTTRPAEVYAYARASAGERLWG